MLQVDEQVEAGSAPASEAAAAVPRPPAAWPLVVLGWLGVLGAMFVAREIIVPVVLALLLALLLRPIMRRMRGWYLPDVFSAFLLIAAVVAVFVFGVWRLAGQAQEWLAQAPATVQKVSRMLPANIGPMQDLEKTTDAVQDLGKSDKATEPLQVEMKSSDLAYTMLGVSGHFIGEAVIVFVVAFFVLALSDTLLRQAIASRPTFVEKRNIVQVLQNVESGISRYLTTITVINIGLGAATALAVWLLGIPNPILWGVMATTLNYVPHVGAFLCMVVLFFVGSVAHESIAWGAAAAGTFAVLTSVESYFVTPLVLSKSLQLSPLAVILSILFWGWLWGIAGGLMAAPLLAVIKIVCDQFDSLRTYSAFLGGEATEHKGP